MTTDQEAENVAASVLHLLRQRGKDAENWRRQSKDWEARCVELRTQVDDLTRLLAAVRAERDQYGAGVMRAAADYTALERQLGEAHQMIATLEASAAFQIGSGIISSARVSSDNAKPTITPLEETQGIACPRCGKFLNNLSPGISVVSGGISVCTTCVRAGEWEVARAR